MSVAPLIEQAGQFTTGSIAFVNGIGHASSGARLGRIMRASMQERPGAYQAVRAAVGERINSLGGAGQSLGLFLLAADMATTAAIADSHLNDDDRRQLRRLWCDLLAREAIDAVA